MGNVGLNIMAPPFAVSGRYHYIGKYDLSIFSSLPSGSVEPG